MSGGPSDPARSAAAAKSKETRERNSSNANFVALFANLCKTGDLDTQTVTTMLRAAVNSVAAEELPVPGGSDLFSDDSDAGLPQGRRGKARPRTQGGGRVSHGHGRAV